MKQTEEPVDTRMAVGELESIAREREAKQIGIEEAVERADRNGTYETVSARIRSRFEDESDRERRRLTRIGWSAFRAAWEEWN